jgi:hypothetical protein
MHRDLRLLKSLINLITTIVQPDIDILPSPSQSISICVPVNFVTIMEPNPYHFGYLYTPASGTSDSAELYEWFSNTVSCPSQF